VPNGGGITVVEVVELVLLLVLVVLVLLVEVVLVVVVLLLVVEVVIVDVVSGGTASRTTSVGRTRWRTVSGRSGSVPGPSSAVTRWSKARSKRRQRTPGTQVGVGSRTPPCRKAMSSVQNHIQSSALPPEGWKWKATVDALCLLMVIVPLRVSTVTVGPKGGGSPGTGGIGGVGIRHVGAQA